MRRGPGSARTSESALIASTRRPVSSRPNPHLAASREGALLYARGVLSGMSP